MERFFNPEMSLDHMLQKIRGMIRVLPAHMAEIVRFACLTGLRPAEAAGSVKLLGVGDISNTYYNQEQKCLEHFRFPSVFIRQTKKTYISYLSLDNFHHFANLGPKTPTSTWNAIRLACRYRNINMDMRLCRKIFASHLIKSGIDSNTVDMLSGRCPSSVLVRHYQVPDASLSQKVLAAVSELQKQITITTTA
jgi:intergrase/recombinase